MIRVFCPLFKKLLYLTFVYTLSSANIDQSAPNFGKIYMNIRSRMSSIMDVIAKMSLIMGQVIPDQSLLSALEIEKLNFSCLFGIYLRYPVLLRTHVSHIRPSWSSCVHFYLLRVIIYKSRTILFSIQREIIITYLFIKLTKVSQNISR